MIFRTHAREFLWRNHEVWFDLKLHSNNWNLEIFIGLSYKKNLGISKCWQNNRVYISDWQRFNRNSS